MMESCGICFPVRRLPESEWEYIAPELLPTKSEAQETLLAGRLLKSLAPSEAEARYPFLHEGVLRNYLSRIGTRAGDSAIYWKYGCWFYEKTTESRALIEGQWLDAKKESGEGTIRIRAWGDGARRLIQPLLHELYRLPIGQQPEVTWTELGTAFSSASMTSETGGGSQQGLETLVPTQALQPASGTPEVYVSYAWEQSEKVVDDMCGVMEAEGWRVIHDKTAMKCGDRISDFMKCLSRGDLVVLVLSAKYLRSKNCMAELYGIYQRAAGDRDEFQDRIIPVALDDAKIATLEDRYEITRYWQEQFQKTEKILPSLSQQDFGLYKSMQDWHNRVGDILAYANDVLGRRGFEAIVKDNFAALRQMLQAKRVR
jgi:internalin A